MFFFSGFWLAEIHACIFFEVCNRMNPAFDHVHRVSTKFSENFACVSEQKVIQRPDVYLLCIGIFGYVSGSAVMIQ